MTGPKDPLGPPKPGDPFWVPDDWPRFYLATPMPVDPVPPPTLPGQRPKMCCPHCGDVLSTGTDRSDGQGRPQQVDDPAVCINCLGLCVATESGWRIATYDEAEKWDADPRVRAMRAIWGKDLPGPD